MTALRKLTAEPGDTARIVEHINALTEQDLQRLGAWSDLTDLSSGTIFAAIDADPDSVVIDREGQFEAMASVYVTLVYGSGDDQDSMSDEYPVTLTGRLSDDSAEIATAVTDTSSFYA